jgi:uncharacterized protein YecE (DUF72 family)
VATGTFRVGTSGYQYDHWVNHLYPEDLPKSKWFARYAEEFDSVEINNTFYHLPAPDTFDAWRDQTPPGFRYALKYSRFGTHMKKLKDPDQHAPRFVEHAERLRSFLGPILVQLPPNWNVDLERLKEFLVNLPRRHRWAVELRNPSWFTDDVFDALRAHNVALCLHDLVDNHPQEVTADWVYLRFHGPNPANPYTEAYSPQALRAAADRITQWRDEERDVFAYFNNDQDAHAVKNARKLREFVMGDGCGRRGGSETAR